MTTAYMGATITLDDTVDNVTPSWYNALDADDQRFADEIWNALFRLYPESSSYIHWQLFLRCIGAKL